MSIEVQDKISLVVEFVLNKKATDVVTLDLRSISAFTDFFVICSGNSLTQVKTIADYVICQMKKYGEIPHIVEGYKECRWVLIDYGDVILHVFYKDVRNYYDIESLWGDADAISYVKNAEAVGGSPKKI